MSGYLLYRCRHCKAHVTWAPVEDVATSVKSASALPTVDRHECGEGTWGVVELIGGLTPPEPDKDGA